MSTLFNVAFERTLRDIFQNNKANIENALQDLLLPIANDYLNQLTLQDLLALISGGGSDSGGPIFDGDTGELVCGTSEKATTVIAETSQSADITETPDYEPTTVEKGFESTTILDPDDESNSSNFLFNKFQVMILMVATIVCLRIS